MVHYYLKLKMGKLFQFNKTYFKLVIALFLVEVFIALFIKDNFIRPYIGDLLVVILIYCFLKSFLRISIKKAATITLLFSYVVEILQYFNLIKHLGLENYRLAKVILGSTFTWVDMICYTIGIAIVLFVENKQHKK